MKLLGIRAFSIALGIGGVFALQALTNGFSAYIQQLFVFTALYVVLAVSLNLINGITGQFSLGHAAFYQVGAYTTGLISVHYFTAANMPSWLWLICMVFVGAVAAAIAGLIVGLPSLRLKGDYLAIVTLGFAEIVRIVSTQLDLVGRAAGFDVNPRIQLPWLAFLLAIVCIAVCRNLIKTAHGLPFFAVREDEVASSAMGVNVTKTKVVAFLIGSAFAGMAGALYAHYNGNLNPQMFRMEVSFIILTMVVLGGSGSITGTTLAAIVLYLIPEILRTFRGDDGASLSFFGPAVAGAIVAVAMWTAAMRLIARKFHGPRLQRYGLVAGAVLAAFILQRVFGAVFSNIPFLAAQNFDLNQLRMVIFSGTLIILMLLRPQGVFAHHEFSWEWLRSVFVRKRPTGVPS